MPMILRVQAYIGCKVQTENLVTIHELIDGSALKERIGLSVSWVMDEMRKRDFHATEYKMVVSFERII